MGQAQRLSVLQAVKQESAVGTVRTPLPQPPPPPPAQGVKKFQPLLIFLSLAKIYTGLDWVTCSPLSWDRTESAFIAHHTAFKEEVIPQSLLLTAFRESKWMLAYQTQHIPAPTIEFCLHIRNFINRHLL